MKTPLITVLFCSLFLAACSDNNDTATEVSLKQVSSSSIETSEETSTSAVDSAKEKTTEVIAAAKDKTAEVMDATKEKSAELVSAAKEKAEEAMADGSAKEMIDDNKDALKAKLGL